jgi:apoptosis-inducing factor 1
MPYLRPPLSKELWFESKESTIENYDSIEFTDWKGNTKPISFENSEFYKKMGVELILGTEATSLDSEKHEVSLSNGTVLEFERLLIATGAEPKCLDVPIDEYVRSRVLTFRTVSDFANLNNLLKTSSGKKIVVIGGGFLGSELAVSISRFGSNLGHKVTQIFPEDGNMALVFPKYLSRWTTEKVSSLGVTVRSGRLVTCIERNELEDGDRLRLVLDNGEKVEADHVIVAVGVDPSFNKMFGASSLPLNEETGGVEADRYLRVAPDVFAAGDVVSYVDPILNCRRRTEHFDHAILSGKLAGQNMVRSISKDSTVLLEPYANESMFW